MAYRHIHAAQTQILDLYDEDELRAEIPDAVARAQTALNREDPRQLTIAGLSASPPELLRPRLRRATVDSYGAIDTKHGQLRNFRNVLLMSAMLISLLVVATLVVVARRPHIMPLCFPRDVTTGSNPVVTEQVGLNCPTRSHTDAPTGGDVLVVALLGLLGGALAAALSIRNLKGTTSAYDVPVALAWLKVPLGAMTAILALVAIRANFVPGLSALDSQEQILAYALVFGYAQQLLTGLIDKRALGLLDSVPSKDAEQARPQLSAVTPVATGDGRRPATRAAAPAEAPAAVTANAGAPA
jgi:hypothetical protein